MLKNFLTVSSWTMLSRILGLVRDQLLAAFMGAGPLQDAYQVALRLPNMFRSLFGEGAFNSAFVPLFSAILAREGKPAAQAFAREALSVLIFWLTGITILGEIFMPQIAHVIAPGYTGHTYDLAVSLTRITFPYLVLICAAALVSGVLNSLHQFGMASAAYVMFNVIGIAAVLWLSPYTPTVAHAAAWGVAVSGIVQLAMLLRSCARAGITLALPRPRLTPRIRQLSRRMIPGLIGSGVTQINLTVDTIIGTLLPSGSVSLMYFADRINQLPLGVLGAAAGTTLLPVLTRHVAESDEEGAIAAQNRAMEYALVLTLPAALALLVLATPIMATLFGHGAFTTRDAELSAQSLRAYAIGLPAFVMIKVLAPGFYARGDTVTPVRIGMMTLLLNFGLNLVLMKPLAHIGPPLASSLAAFVNVSTLGTILFLRGALRPERHSLLRILRMILASAAMSLVLLGLMHTPLGMTATHHGIVRILDMTALTIAGILTYGICVHVFGVADLRVIPASLRRRLRRRAA